MLNVEEAATIRGVMQNLPKAGASSIGSPPSPEQMYVLPAHYSALNPDVSLVVGNRGMGKTFWAVTLADPVLRATASKRSAPAAQQSLSNLIVLFGFSGEEGASGVSSDALRGFANVRAEDVWRGVLLNALSTAIARPIGLKEAISFSSTRPDDVRATLRRYDEVLAKDGKKVVVLFDQLDHLANNWNEIQALTKGLLKLALAMKSYRSIRLKVFMRSDQYADRSLFDFPDASKVRHEATMLHWYSNDLYGLFYTWLWRDDGARRIMQNHIPLSLSSESYTRSKVLPLLLRASSEAQGAMFDLLAGSQMGKGSKRGRPYSWILTHLMDGVGEVAPRSFLHALSVAADRYPDSNQSLAIDYDRIQEGVSSASEIRRSELLEDYPWIREALEPLHGLTVPAKRAELRARWQEAETPEKILTLHVDAKAPVELVAAQQDSTSQLDALERALGQVGVLQARDNQKVNIPDIFRIAAGIMRKGGIKPQQRRQI